MKKEEKTIKCRTLCATILGRTRRGRIIKDTSGREDKKKELEESVVLLSPRRNVFQKVGVS